ncbi:ribbon-helix-helix domain-containing protein [uncultured Ruegeria sp.]|uniref:ribbon-helix-helix domain-containing protein n=1 Tax=uncultured Ruegeria sp. TaxID=259304 RepID=UPI00262BC059|nr:ribbon-helix-helix domain-containing protein [uncultured Ruegeria sp.]
MTDERNNKMDQSTDEKMVLRTVFLPASIDKLLKGIAFDENKSKSELIRQYISQGLEERSPS